MSWHTYIIIIITTIIIIKAASSIERVFDAPQADGRTSTSGRCLEDSAVGKRGKFQADGTMYLGVTAVS